ncbi:hypothetical protein [Nitrosomonas sp.]|uniref:hypothetical protein n=1 Tax=Nitrosomonas sp. TaxID=42353 RepID=UPI001DCAAF91|nr:hypothetical protein [Nitrosomonas sp.]MBX3617714.1 hypothetical protein [Nitrosomonas sp.]
MDAVERKRKIIIGSALIATLIAAVLVDDEEEFTLQMPETPLQPAKTTQEKNRKAEPNTAQLDVSKLGQRKFNPQAGELFASTTWMSKRTPLHDPEEHEIKIVQPVKIAPPAPTAPPLQFKYAGKAIADNATWVFLSHSGENLITKIGGKINDQYRLDAISDDTVTVTYLPLNVKQTLTINHKLAGNFR